MPDAPTTGLQAALGGAAAHEERLWERSFLILARASRIPVRPAEFLLFDAGFAAFGAARDQTCPNDKKRRSCIPS